MRRIVVDAEDPGEPTRDHPSKHPSKLGEANETKVHPKSSGEEDGNIFFVGTATTFIEWANIRIMTDPNFLHAGDHVHLGPGVTGTRLTNPAVDLHDIPPVHFILLSHYHADHFDQKVEGCLTRDIPIITTPHAKGCLESKGDDSFTKVEALDTYQSMLVEIKSKEATSKKEPAIKVTAMPGKHVPPGPLSTANDILKAVPPTNGWMVELGHTTQYHHVEGDFETNYRIYISGDTLMCDELKEIPKIYADQKIDLMLIHLGGTTIPSPNIPLLMVTMDAKQGIELLKLVCPDMTIPIHYDDYDVFLSPLSDFKKAVEEAGLSSKVVYLDRKDQYKFKTTWTDGS
ncbi:TPA_exp: Uncharacterized protein A8136_6365 [Trichophyton benhamiae CBS 112371]|nr:TPA_exp: Uncharacterized protein A8136_6365 [Trichophyton benhamiae CBS 112371]